MNNKISDGVGCAEDGTLRVHPFDPFKYFVTPVFEFDEDGGIKPNFIFHRSIDKVHSRCIEYPFAASRLADGKAKHVLDVGTVKSSPLLIRFLENLPLDVCATDFDEAGDLFKRVSFRQADVRSLPFSDSEFDKITAISVIEHIGLAKPQVNIDVIPEIDTRGDEYAVQELARVLKPGGELIMTLPFGMREGLILGSEARNYTINGIKKFEKFLKPVVLEYYEYQCCSTQGRVNNSGILNRLKQPVKQIRSSVLKNQMVRKLTGWSEELPGEVTWKRIPMEHAKAEHIYHTEGVLCGVWKKFEHFHE